MRKTRSYSHIHILVVTAAVIICIAASFIFVSQYKQLKKRNDENVKLKNELHELDLERARLRLLSQYVGTEEYAKYYARYRLGYKYPDEIILEK